MSDLPGNVENVKKLLNHKAFDLRNPNKVCIFEFDVFRTLKKTIRSFGGSDMGYGNISSL